MRRLLTITALCGALAIAASATAGAHGPTISEKVIGAAGINHSFKVNVKRPADAVVARATVPPGASFGWHWHRAAVVAIVQSGTLTLYDSADPTCTPQRFSAGHGFTERRGHVHLARNEGRKPAVVLVTYLGLKHGVNPDVPAKRPGNCRF
jgi:quercetin dioxygenase-like cupin family protein